jgi:stage V sporulation protein B
MILEDIAEATTREYYCRWFMNATAVALAMAASLPTPCGKWYGGAMSKADGSAGDSPPPSRPAAAPDDAAQAGRGVLYIGLAKLYFILAGAIIEFRLPVILGNTLFGAYGVVVSAVSPINNVLVTGTIQAVSRFTAQQPSLARAVQAASFRMHLGLGLPVALVFMLGAPVYAYFVHDPSKIGLLVLGGAIIGGNAFYAVFVGTANGTRAFHKQAALDMGFATLRALGILGLATAGMGVYGAISGWVGAVVVILALAALLVGVPRQAGTHASANAGTHADKQSIRPMAAFFGGVAAYLVLLNLIMVADVHLLKRFSTEWFAAHADAVTAAVQAHVPGVAGGIIDFAADPAKAADGQVGYYRAVQNLARLSYQVIIAGMFVIFPLVSRSTFENDRDTTRRYVHTTMRYSLIFATAVGVVMAANPEPVLDVVYPAAYAYFGAPALIALALGNVAFCLFAIAGTILNGAGHTRAAIVTAAVTLVAAVLANALVIPRFPPGRDILLAAASATAGAMVIGAALGGVFLVRKLGAFMPWATLVRVLLAVAAALLTGRLVPFTTPLLTLVEAVLVAVSYLAVLVLTRELTGRDLAALLSLGRRRKPAAAAGAGPGRSEP